MSQDLITLPDFLWTGAHGFGHLPKHHQHESHG